MKKSISLIAVLAVMLSFVFALSVESVSAKTIKTNVYCECCKVGSYVYCGSTNTSFYKVNLKTKSVKRLMKGSYSYTTGPGPNQMKKYKNHLYISTCGGGAPGNLYRMNLKNDKISKLASKVYGYFTIKNNKIYYPHFKITKVKGYNHYAPGSIDAVMNLNGKNKKKTAYSVKSSKIYYTNAKGYKVVYRDSDEESLAYLKTPKRGKIYLGKAY